ncbi:MAG TPA: twin-arginine translocase subunit TatC [Spirochaetales bacterium]|nr:twin-arginine translocase subunit TatC [Spirochaetales bacterium]
MENSNPKDMTVLDHINELRRRLLISIGAFLVCAVVALVFYKNLISLFTSQFESLQNGLGATLFANSIAEGFLVQLKTAGIFGLIFSLPVHIVNIVQFIFPAMDARYHKVVVAGLVCSFFLAAFGAYVAYFRIVPFSINFLTNQVFIPSRVGILLNFQQSIDYVLSFLLWAIITFQAPIVLEILMMFGVLKRKALLHASRYAIVGIVTLSAIVTPSVDPVSQLSIAAPLVLLYYLAILVAKVFDWGKD